jgi:hypothetical protein
MAQIEDLLDQVAQALFVGHLDQLAALTQQIESAGLPQDRTSAERLHAKAQRNARLLDAATRGVKAARLRVAEITRGPTLTTYDARGHKALIPQQGTGPSRRV